MTTQIVGVEHWKDPRGYSNGMLTGDGVLYVAGQIGWNENQIIDTDDFALQAKQALENVVSVVEAAGGNANDVVRLTWFITDKASYLAAQKDIGQYYRSILGKHFPAMSVVVVSALLEDRALVEIEATAVIRTHRR